MKNEPVKKDKKSFIEKLKLVFAEEGKLEVKMFYYIENEVTDNDTTKTNTGQSFLCNEYIAWSRQKNLWVHIGGITKKPHNTKSIYKSSDFPSN